MITKRILTERTQRILAGGYPSLRDRITLPEIEHALFDQINKALKAELLDTTLGVDGESLPEGSIIATYEKNDIQSYGDWSRIKLPATPLILPDRMGVFGMHPYEKPDLEPKFRLLPAALYHVWAKDAMVSPLSDVYLCSWEGSYITVYKNLADDGYDVMTLKLCLADLSTYGDYDPLPLPADLADTVIMGAISLLTASPKNVRGEGIKAQPEQ